MALILASCNPQPNWIPRNPKFMFQICQKLRRGFCMEAREVFAMTKICLYSVCLVMSKQANLCTFSVRLREWSWPVWSAAASEARRRFSLRAVEMIEHKLKRRRASLAAALHMRCGRELLIRRAPELTVTRGGLTFYRFLIDRDVPLDMLSH